MHCNAMLMFCRCAVTDIVCIRGGAIESFHIAIQLAPEPARATYYFNLAHAHSEQRGWPQAIEAFKKAIEIKPTKHVYHNLIVSHSHQHTRWHNGKKQHRAGILIACCSVLPLFFL